MKARPILFSGPMIRALLNGRKTQTRRVIKPQPAAELATYNHGLLLDEMAAVCPYGLPGDLLWVREAFNADWSAQLLYKADDPTGRAARDAGYTKEPRYRPSIHMPRRSSRLTLEITDVRVQRLQDIGERQAISEGIYNTADATFPMWTAGEGFNEHMEFPRDAFRELWESINGPGSWDVNPWVWALAFRVHRCNIDELLKQREAA